MTTSARTRKTVWCWGRNVVPVYVVREGARRWAVWTIAPTHADAGERWGHFPTMRQAGRFARAVVDGRVFMDDCAGGMVVDQSKGGGRIS
jgi:hypothetical protein